MRYINTYHSPFYHLLSLCLSAKGRAFKLSTETETGLRQVLQDPLRGYSQWSQLVSQILEASAEVSEFSHIALLVQNIEVTPPRPLESLPCARAKNTRDESSSLHKGLCQPPIPSGAFQFRIIHSPVHPIVTDSLLFSFFMWQQVSSFGCNGVVGGGGLRGEMWECLPSLMRNTCDWKSPFTSTRVWFSL